MNTYGYAFGARRTSEDTRSSRAAEADPSEFNYADLSGLYCASAVRPREQIVASLTLANCHKPGQEECG